MNHIYVLGVDMQEHNVEESARDAAIQIVDLFDRLVEEQENKPNQMTETENQ